MKDQLGLLAVAALLWLNACGTTTPTPRVATGKAAEPAGPTVAALSAPTLRPADWNTLTGWSDDDILPALDAFLRSCAVLKSRPLWQEACTQADTLRGQDGTTLRKFFQSHFVPHQVLNPDGSGDGLITGYY